MGELFKIGDEMYGVDEFGEYGSLLDDESERQVPEPINLEPPPPPWPIEDVEPDDQQ